MKHKSNQIFTTFDFIITTVSVIVIIGVVGPIIQKNLQYGNIEKAQKETHEIAFDLLNSGDSRSFQNINQSRGIASVQDNSDASAWVGKAKTDPWGNPYHFRFLRNSKGMPVQIVVWSGGPDRKTNMPSVKLSSIDGLEHMEFASDDVVASVPLR